MQVGWCERDEMAHGSAPSPSSSPLPALLRNRVAETPDWRNKNVGAFKVCRKQRTGSSFVPELVS